MPTPVQGAGPSFLTPDWSTEGPPDARARASERLAPRAPHSRDPSPMAEGRTSTELAELAEIARIQRDFAADAGVAGQLAAFTFGDEKVAEAKTNFGAEARSQATKKFRARGFPPGFAHAAGALNVAWKLGFRPGRNIKNDVTRSQSHSGPSAQAVRKMSAAEGLIKDREEAAHRERLVAEYENARIEHAKKRLSSMQSTAPEVDPPKPRKGSVARAKGSLERDRDDTRLRRYASSPAIRQHVGPRPTLGGRQRSNASATATASGAPGAKQWGEKTVDRSLSVDHTAVSHHDPSAADGRHSDDIGPTD